MRTLGQLWARRDEYTRRASDTVRNSALAGLAAVWLFSGAAKDQLDALGFAPWGLLIAGAFFAASLAADILHYFVAGEIVYRLAKRKEAENGGYDEDAVVELESSDMRWPIYLYRAKAGFLFVGYTLLTGVLVRYSF